MAKDKLTVEELEAKLAAAEKENQALKAENEGTAALLEQANNMNRALTTATQGTALVVTIGKKSCRVVHGVTIPGRTGATKVTAEELAKNPELCAKLLAKRSTAIEVLN